MITCCTDYVLGLDEELDNVKYYPKEMRESIDIKENVLSLEEAKRLAISEGKKIKHKYFLDREFIYFEDGKWLTEEGYELPHKYWLGMDANWQTGWSLHVD